MPVTNGIFGRLGRLVVRFRWPVLIGYIVSLVVFGIVGSGVFASLASEGFGDPGSESASVEQILEDDFASTSPAVVLAVESNRKIDAKKTLTEVTTLIDELEQVEGVESVTSYWTSGKPESLRGNDGRTGQVLVFFDSAADVTEVGRAIGQEFDGQRGDLTVYAFGGAVIGPAFNDTITSDLARAEAIAIPITIVLLLFVFGSVVAAGLPFIVAGASILGSFTVIYVIAQFTDVSIFSVNLVTGLGLALGIDYALLAINRFREELKRGNTTEDAVVITMSTAGKTVFVSGITVAVTLASLLFFPQYFLKSFAYAGIAVSVFAVLGSITALPAVLAILGPRVNKLKIRRGDLAPKDTGVWSRVALFVMKRPWPVLIAVIAVLFVVASPAVTAVIGQVDDRALPKDSAVAVAGQVLRDRFPGQEGSPYTVLLERAGSQQEVDDYAKQLSTIDNVVRVTTPTAVIADGEIVAPIEDAQGAVAGDYTRIDVIGDVQPISPDGEALVAQIRETSAPAQAALVGGIAASFADSNAGIYGNFWIVALWIGVATLIILFLYTGSVLLPIKAVILNVISLAATLGALVWVFQNNHLTWLTGEYVPTGTIDISTVALIGVTAFALSMDYELFLLSRIKEEHDAGRDTVDAVAFGLQRTGRIITAAALLIAIVFAAFLSSGVTNIKQLGFGVTFAILVDATIVRGLLVPAFMRIAGRANWWAPKPLRKLHERFALTDG